MFGALLLAGCAAIIANAQQPFVPPNSPVIPSEIWPLPVSMQAGSAPAIIDASLTFSCGLASCPDPLNAAFQRYLTLIFFAGPPSGQQSGNVINAVQFNILSASDLFYGVDESYNMSVPSSGTVTISAATQWGALRALESFSQLIIWQGSDAPANAYMITNTPLTVQDYPRYQWRGFLIDTSFNFLSVTAIKRVLDAMSYAKFNILHWHATDDPSWPLTSATYPNFTIYGPFSRKAVYSIQDQMDIQQYAYERGILILIELDMPGHAEIWKAGNPDYVISCAGGQTLLTPIDSSGIYDVIRNLIVEFTERFPGMPFIHLGGDEVNTLDCWNRSAAVQAFMKQQNIANVTALREYFQMRIQDISRDLSLQSLMWEEVFNNHFTFQNTSIVTPWISPNVTRDATQMNIRIVNYYSYYLDQQIPPGVDIFGPDIGPIYYYWQDTWQSFYNYDPVASSGVSPANAGLVLGGTASLWGEQVDSTFSGLQAMARAWPRAAATAERLWSPSSVTIAANGLEATTARLEHFRCHIAQRGVPAGPLSVASDFGFCWSPTWDTEVVPAGGVVPSTSTDTVSTGGAAGIGIVCFLAGMFVWAAILPWLRKRLFPTKPVPYSTLDNNLMASQYGTRVV